MKPFKLGELPDHDRPLPNWLQIKNEQQGKVDISTNTADELVSMSNEAFNELIGNDKIDNDILLVFLTTLDDGELQRFYRYLDDTVRPGNDPQASSPRKNFEAALAQVREAGNVEQLAKQRATLETPMNIRFAKSLYGQTTRLRSELESRYFDYENGAEKQIEGHLNMALFEEMKYIPTHYEQTLDFMRDRYLNPTDERCRRFADHLCDRFGYLIYGLYRLNHHSQITEAEPGADSLAWFVATFLQERGLDISELEEKAPLTYYVASVYHAIADQDEDLYLGALVRVTLELLSYYPLNSDAAEYALVETMKSVALKQVSPENAQSFLNLFTTLPHLYDRLNYQTLMRLKETINQTLAQYKPHENKVFAEHNLSTLVMLDYLIDMEDLYSQDG
ncbi:hypothetical protein [Thiomicrospira sp. ALE5]|uniref:hypothetical protein n=1 Tax=Thiomicrospira sp. ALE5 TaxID=748650 RepID=UPI0008EBBC05|nr:hypothetical protein [Thiomicrospira sp. ALE5]SFR54025.1 hypothetical protein SAMN03092900_0951 [Thiomicrospira sp. ALE5]